MNNYKKEYDELIEKIQKENRGIEKLKDHGKYFNIHHIVPRSLGGSDDDSNLIKLTHAEHFEAHKLLYYIYKDSGRDGFKMAKTFIMMSGIFTINAEDYAEAKRTLNDIGLSRETRYKMSESQIGEKNHRFGKGHLQMGENNPMYNKGHLSAGSRNGMYGMSGEKNPFYGMNHTDEFKEMMRMKFGHVIIYEGVEYKSVRDAERITKVSRYFIKKNGIYKNK